MELPGGRRAGMLKPESSPMQADNATASRLSASRGRACARGIGYVANLATREGIIKRRGFLAAMLGAGTAFGLHEGSAFSIMFSEAHVPRSH